jgi:L-ascorbate metabolism protein UlaG (beta-lactamase superfamily)
VIERLRALPLDSGQAAFWWLGQSSFLLRLGDAVVLVDPFLAPHPDRLVPPPFAPEDAVGLDVVACTHDHLDHLDRDSLAGIAAASPDASVLVPRPVVDDVVALGVARARVIGAEPGKPVEVGSVKVHPVPACHGDSAEEGYTFGPDGLVRFLGYVFEANGVRVYHSGDTIPYEGLASGVRALAPEVALLPINGRDAEREALGIVGNLDEWEAAELAAEAAVDLLVPMHWDMFASNPGSPARLLDAARLHPRLAVLVPSRDRPFVYSRAAL